LPQFSLENEIRLQRSHSRIAKNSFGLIPKKGWSLHDKHWLAFVAVVYDSPERFYGLSVSFSNGYSTIQVYCDFLLDYSDTAIGVAQLFQFQTCCSIFRTPLQLNPGGSFGTRWHITLSTWF